MCVCVCVCDEQAFCRRMKSLWSQRERKLLFTQEIIVYKDIIVYTGPAAVRDRMKSSWSHGERKLLFTQEIIVYIEHKDLLRSVIA